MKFIFALAIFFIDNLCLAAPSGDVVDTGYAKYLGTRTSTYPNAVAYLGIPYAEPPLGDLRYHAPVPLDTARITKESNGSVIDATQYPDMCIQGTTGGGDAGGAGSEDCLKVNIYAPAGAKQGSNFPVLAYIHGGGYIFGNPETWPFNHWIQQSPNIVVVSIYYRLSSFGFLTIPEFKDHTNGDFNAGFKDQIQALKWIKQNIASFGGDPNKVTINGGSAGGSSVELHLTANEDTRLFSGAIAQSVYRTPLPFIEQQATLFQTFAQLAGCGTGSNLDKLACLRSADVTTLTRAQDGAYYAFTQLAYKFFHPVIDNTLFKEYPTKLILLGQFARVPLMVGASTNETLSPGTDISAALKDFAPSLTDSDIQVILAAYPSSAFASEALRFQVVTGDLALKCAVPIMAAPFSLTTSKTFTYRYNQKNPTTTGMIAGVGHVAELYHMFLGSNYGLNGTFSFNPLAPVETAFSQELIAYWISFIRSGDPNSFKLQRSPEWPSYDIARRNNMVLQQDPRNSLTQSGFTIEQEAISMVARCAVMASQVDHQQN